MNGSKLTADRECFGLTKIFGVTIIYTPQVIFTQTTIKVVVKLDWPKKKKDWKQKVFQYP